MFDMIDLLFKYISKKRFLRVSFGLIVVIVPISVVLTSIYSGSSIANIIEELSPIIISIVTTVLGFSLAFSRPEPHPRASDEQTKSTPSNHIDGEELTKQPSDDLPDVFYTFRIRMLYDAERLKANSFKNLSIGILFSFAAFSLLSYFVLLQVNLEQGSDYISFMMKWYLPRITIVILLQFVGFFFLRLYVASELDLKHNKNEITNIESQFMAYLMSREYGADLVKIVVEKMASTERNFIIKNGEKTISLENESQYNDLKELSLKIVDKIPEKRSD